MCIRSQLSPSRRGWHTLHHCLAVKSCPVSELLHSLPEAFPNRRQGGLADPPEPTARPKLLGICARLLLRNSPDASGSRQTTLRIQFLPPHQSPKNRQAFDSLNPKKVTRTPKAPKAPWGFEPPTSDPEVAQLSAELTRDCWHQS